MIIIDGSHGEGGGQMLRTSLSMSALTGRPFRMEHIRAGRKKPGLRYQHLTAVLAVADLCQAEVRGAAVNSQFLEFVPQARPTAGKYTWDVTDVAPNGSAGAIMLIWQTVLWPLLFASGANSQITLRGGTHVSFSPSFHYIQNVFVPSLRHFGVSIQPDLIDWGWYPLGGGQIQTQIRPISHLEAADFLPEPINSVNGLAVVTNLPGHIPHRMSRRAHNLLTEQGWHAAVQALRLKSNSTGAGLFLWLPSNQAGVTSLGSRGLPAQTVAEHAVDELIEFAESGAAVDPHLADQLLIPMALAHGTSSYTTNQLTQHTLTNIDILQKWLDADISYTGSLNQPAEISVTGIGYSAPTS